MVEELTVTVAPPPPSYTEIREELHQAVIADLLGPAGGPEEEIVGTTVRDRYLVGKLAPPKSIVRPEENDDLSGESATDYADGATEDRPPPVESLIPSAFGLTFCVDTNIHWLEVHASWGQYLREDSEVHLTESGKPRKVWKRHPAGGKVDLDLSPGPIRSLVPDTGRPLVYLRGVVRPPTPKGEKIVTIFLVNGPEAQEKNQDEAWLFQTELRLMAPDGSAIFRRRPAGESRVDDQEMEFMAMLYRNQVEFAVGHGVGVHAIVADGKPDRAIEICTRVIPFHDVPVTEAPSERDIPAFSDLILDMKTLSELEREDLIRTLSILPDEYEKWIDAQSNRIESGEIESYEEAARSAIEQCRKTLDRIREGIQVLDLDVNALKAFRFSNAAMGLQRVRSIYSLRRRRGEDIDLEDIDIPSNRSWRPFQLAFILLNLPSLADPKHSDRVGQVSSIADLLWFPTGGGKTEAYLGVAAFAMAIRRLQGLVGGYDGTQGLAVIMRYTLRLLTIQQFQRASTLLCAMEDIRKEAAGKGDRRWGETPFRIGLWVGNRVTPGTTKDSAEGIRNANDERWRFSGSGTPAQLTNCPWCGCDIRLGRDIKVDEKRGRTFFFCSDPNGKCRFTAAKSGGEGLPVLVVDEEIYRLLPAMVIATVDKFAQMPWKGEVQTLFGRVSGFCPRHGFLTPESEDTGNHRRTGSLPATTRQDSSPLRPPDLIIQDELHLISGPLGTLVGLYEGAVDELSAWEFEGKKIRPKVIASTATVRRAKEQVYGIFLRQVKVFPPNGLDASDNFFSVQRPISPEKFGRRYMGICAPGQPRPSVMIRAYTAFLTAAQSLRKKYGPAGDPWMTLVGYFNSLRELGGMLRLTQDDVRRRCFMIEKADLERPGLSQRDVRNINELTSRISSADIPKILDLLEIGFPAVGGETPSSPVDVLLATNMVSVGVDVQRLGLMVVNGQPKTTAEYIQATSRVGRRYPGMVCTVLNWARPRDLSHYETFEHYHATFYRHVEALSVTPYAPRAVDRGLTGMVASLIRLRSLELNKNEAAGNLTSPVHPQAVLAGKAIASRAWSVTDDSDVKDRVEQMIAERLDRWAQEAQRGGRRLGYKGRRDGATVGLLRKPGNETWGMFTTPTSMREVEPDVSLVLGDNLAGDMPAWRQSQKQEKPDDEAKR